MEGGCSDTILEGDHPRTIPDKSGSVGLEVRSFLNVSQICIIGINWLKKKRLIEKHGIYMLNYSLPYHVGAVKNLSSF